MGRVQGSAPVLMQVIFCVCESVSVWARHPCLSGGHNIRSQRVHAQQDVVWVRLYMSLVNHTCATWAHIWRSWTTYVVMSESREPHMSSYMSLMESARFKGVGVQVGSVYESKPQTPNYKLLTILRRETLVLGTWRRSQQYHEF